MPARRFPDVHVQAPEPSAAARGRRATVEAGRNPRGERVMTMTTENTEDNHGARLPMDIPGLDRICGGGFMKGSIYLFMGRPGTGKTTLGNQLCFAHARRRGRFDRA